MENYRNCESEGQEYIESKGLKVALFLQIICSFIAIIINIIFLKTDFKQVYFHQNVRVIILSSAACKIIHSVFCILLQGIHLYLYNFSTNGCDIYVSQLFCLVLRSPITFTMISFVPLNSIIVVERLVASMKLHAYELYSRLLGFLLLGFAILFSLGLLIFGIWYTPWNEPTALCLLTSNYTYHRMSIISAVLIGIEAFAIVGFGVLWWFNYKWKNMRVYDVRTSYQVHENIGVLALLLPRMIFHLIIFTCYHFSNLLVPSFFSWDDVISIRTAYASVYIVPLYCMLSPFLMSWVVAKQKKRRAQQLQKLSTTTATAEAYQNYLSLVW